MELSQRLHSSLEYIQKIPQQTLSNVISIACVVYLSYLVAGFVWHWVPTHDNNGEITLSTEKVTSSQSNRDAKQDISALLAQQPFGKAPKQEILKPIQVNQPAPQTRLNVNLVGLVADSVNPESKKSVAIIESRAGQDTYGIGERVDGTQANIYQIFTDRVILSIGGRFETLMMEGVEYSTVPPDVERLNQSKAKASSNTATKPVEVANVTNEPATKIDKRQDVELAEQLREQRENLFEDPKKLLDVIRIRPFRQNGELMGYRLSPGRKPELFQSVGLKSNDLAVSINGYDLTDMQQALTVMRELKAMTDATITVMRGEELIDIMLAL